MYSAADLPKEGFPHSDIRGSTIARISPRLFAACHVLHRLLAPRHPPNALVSLTIQSPQRPHAVPNRATSPWRTDSKHYAYQSTLPFPDSPVKDHPARARSTDPAPLAAVLEARAPQGPEAEGHPSGATTPVAARPRLAVALARRQSASSPSGGFLRSAQPSVKMEANGFEPMTPCLQSRCSTS